MKSSASERGLICVVVVLSLCACFYLFLFCLSLYQEPVLVCIFFFFVSDSGSVCITEGEFLLEGRCSTPPRVVAKETRDGRTSSLF